MSIINPNDSEAPFPFPTRRSKAVPPKQHDIVPPADEQQKPKQPEQTFPFPTRKSAKQPYDMTLIEKELQYRKARESSPREPRKPRTAAQMLHYYSPAIARQLNPKQPDVAAAVVLTNLSFWQQNVYPSTLIEGRRHSFRSLKQLHEDCPYLTESAIHKAIQRLERELGAEFVIRRDKKVLYFSIGGATMERLKIEKRTRKKKEDDSTKHLSFLPDDAKKTGSIRSAVLINNLRYQLTQFREPKQDAAGNKYGQLSAVKLAPILEFSADTISRALSEMCKQGHLIPHATDAGFYALPDGFKGSVPPITAGAEVHAKGAEIHATPAEVHSASAEVHSQPAEVHSDTPSNPIQITDAQSITTDVLPGGINECGNESLNQCVKDVIKDSNYAGSASPPCDPSIVSKGLTLLIHSAEAKLAKMRLEASVIKPRSSVHQDELPYDVIDPYELAYEVVSERERTFYSELEDGIELLKEFFHHEGFKITPEDEVKFRKLLRDNPKITAMDLCELYLKVKYPPLIFTSRTDFTQAHRVGILTKVKTPSQFLKYLPQVIVLLNWDGEEEWEWVDIDEPFKGLDYGYLGKAPNSSITFLDDGSVPSKVIED
ncbi:MAG: helix-turn-helix domain-containing protein [Prosthecobacter sp.]